MSSVARRVVVTGLGLISPLGLTPVEAWEAVVAGRSGVGELTLFSAHGLPLRHVAESRGFRGEIDDFGPLGKEQVRAIRKGIKVMCREIQMGVGAAQRALADAGLRPGGFDPDRSGVVFGSDYIMTQPEEFIEGIRACLDDEGRFHFERWAREGLPRVTPLWLLKYLPNMPASHIAIYNDLRGPSNSLTVREASSNLALGEAFTTIQRGSADMLIAGATGTRVHPLRTVHVLLQEQVALNGNDAPLSRPFDLHRTGMVLGEGAGAIILEDLQTARARGARILAELLGHGSSTAADRLGVANLRRAIANALRRAVECAGLAPDAIGHVHAHGLATRHTDRAESQALRDVFDTRPVPVTAAKSYFGNLGAGSGAVELILSLMALRHGRLFPVLNYRTPDPDCPVAVVRDLVDIPGDTMVNVNVTPQGQASAVVVRRWSD